MGSGYFALRAKYSCSTRWDTVGALGAPGVIGKIASSLKGNKYEYHDVGLHPSIRNAYHAMAIDERRTPFAPALWVRPAGWSGHLEQAWFAGVHSSVGGGYRPDGLANGALQWIASKAQALGLDLDRAYLKFFEAHFDSVLHDSMSAKYRMFGSFVRPIGQSRADGECVHASAIQRLKHAPSKYSPQNLSSAIANTAEPLPVIDTQWTT